MISKIKSIFNKDDFDYSEGIVNPYEFHKTFYFFIKAFQVLDDEPLPKWTNFTHHYMIINTIVAILLAFLSLYRSASDKDLLTATEGGTYTIVLIYQLVTALCTKMNLPHYHNFLKDLREDFHFVCTEGEKYRKRYFETQVVTWKLSIFCVVFISCVVILMNLFALGLLLFFLVTRKTGDGGKRPLLMPFWLFDISFTETPVYEIAFVFTTYSVLLFGYNYIFMIQTGIVWVRQITAKADLMIYRIEDLMEDCHPATNAAEEDHYDHLLKLRLREIVKQHHSMYDLLHEFAGVYKKLLMIEQKITAPVVCLTAYGTSEKLAVGEFNAILCLICISTIVVVFIPSYLCTFLGIKIRSISDACWNTPFWNARPVVRPYFVLIIQRSLRPLPLQAPGFADISLQTFSSNMTSAYSMFNMLRQT